MVNMMGFMVKVVSYLFFSHLYIKYNTRTLKLYIFHMCTHIVVVNKIGLVILKPSKNIKSFTILSLF